MIFVRHEINASRTAFPKARMWSEHNCSTGVIVLKTDCTECGKTYSKTINAGELENIDKLYENGGSHPDGHVQDVFISWSDSERELFLMSHICNDCWKMFEE